MKRLILGFIVLLLMDTSAMATTAGKITGVITDAATGESLPGANVTLEGTRKGATTDAEGRYLILAVDPGMYTLTATMVGYGTGKERSRAGDCGLYIHGEFCAERSQSGIGRVGCCCGASACGAGQNHEQIRGFFGRYSGCTAGEIDLAVDRIATGYGTGWHQPHSRKYDAGADGYAGGLLYRWD